MKKAVYSVLPEVIILITPRMIMHTSLLSLLGKDYTFLLMTLGFSM